MCSRHTTRNDIMWVRARCADDVDLMCMPPIMSRFQLVIVTVTHTPVPP